MEISRGTREDVDAVAMLDSDVELLRARWQQPNFDPLHHLWLADGALGALYAPDEAVVRSADELVKVAAHSPTGAVRLYERVGMSVVKRYRFYVKKLKL